MSSPFEIRSYCFMFTVYSLRSLMVFAFFHHQITLISLLLNSFMFEAFFKSMVILGYRLYFKLGH